MTITDFSLAYFHHIPKPIHRDNICLWDAVGSVEYLAPEVLSSNSYNNMVDYWALGIIMFEILRGKVIFPCFHLFPPLVNENGIGSLHS